MKSLLKFKQLEGEFYLSGISVFKHYHGMNHNSLLFVSGTEEFYKLSAVFDQLEYPGILGFEGYAKTDSEDIYYRNLEDLSYNSPYKILSLNYDPKRNVYKDPENGYYDFKDKNPSIDESLMEGLNSDDQKWLFLLETAFLIAVCDMDYSSLITYFYDCDLHVKENNQKVLLAHIPHFKIKENTFSYSAPQDNRGY